MAAEIEAKGIERAAAYNETFRQDEDLATFLLSIENLPKILEERTTLIFDQDSPLVSLLMGLVGSESVGDTAAEPDSSETDNAVILEMKK
jgi:hypothetical protein